MRTNRRPTQQHPSVQGFTLVEIAVVLVILAILATIAGGGIVAAADANRRLETNNNLAKAEAALVSFVSSTRRLPCPADGALPNTDANWGLERRSASGTCDAMVRGVVPWRTVGLTQPEVTDGWQTLFTYRVPLHLTINGGMTMSDCDPAGTDALNTGTPAHICSAACTAGNMATCTMPGTFLSGKGLQIRNAAGAILADPAATPATGAAYVLVSNGPTRGPGYSADGVLIAINGTLGTEEGKNQNNQVLQAYYVDTDPDATATVAHFDDIVRRPSVATIINKANLGPRAH